MVNKVFAATSQKIAALEAGTCGIWEVSGSPSVAALAQCTVYTSNLRARQRPLTDTMLCVYEVLPKVV